jgi:acyl carrier protein
MNHQLETAIIQFVANEYQLDPDAINQDTDFLIDLNLNPEQLTQLIQKMQDSLNFILPEEKIASVNTIGDIIKILTPEDDSDPTPTKSSL